MSEVHTQMNDNRSRDVTRKRRYVMQTAVEAVERNNQTRGFIDCLRRLFYKIYIKASQIMKKKKKKRC